MWTTPTVTQISLRSNESWEKKKQNRVKTGRTTLPPGTLQEQVMMSAEEPCWDWNISPKNPKNMKMEKWPTPVTRDYKDTGTKESMTRALNKRDSPGLALLVGAETGGKLNPTWTEWLMGWPLEWTELKPLVTDKCHCVQQQHGES